MAVLIEYPADALERNNVHYTTVENKHVVLDLDHYKYT